jgi:hypothetical protein
MVVRGSRRSVSTGRRENTAKGSSNQDFFPLEKSRRKTMPRTRRRRFTSPNGFGGVNSSVAELKRAGGAFACSRPRRSRTRIALIPARISLIPTGIGAIRVGMRAIRTRIKAIRVRFKAIRVGIKAIRVGIKAIRVGLKQFQCGLLSSECGLKQSECGLKQSELESSQSELELKRFQFASRRVEKEELRCALESGPFKSASELFEWKMLQRESR